MRGAWCVVYGLFMDMFEIKTESSTPTGSPRGCAVGLHGGQEKEDITNHNYSSADQRPSCQHYTTSWGLTSWAIQMGLDMRDKSKI